MTQINNLKSANKKMPFNTFRNSSISILLALIVIAFNFTRTALTSANFGVDSLGLLTIVLGILPYISGGHNAMISVSSSKLYQSIHFQRYGEANDVISRLKPQYYLFGTFYLAITIALAFALPFIANNSTGDIIVTDGNNVSKIVWYESTLFVLSNAIELIATYYIIPISIILLYISNKSYIYNSLNIVLTIIFNLLIVTIFILINNHTITLSFIEMNIIILCILGSKSILLLLLLIPFRRKYFKWYKYKNVSIKKWKVEKETWQSMFSSYFSQFSSDVIAILFLFYSSLNVSHEHHEISQNIIDMNLRHGTHGGGAESNFIPSSIFTIFLMILTSINEIVHCITDEAIPSVAEHASYNDMKINQHFFHRYQVLSLFIAVFSSSSYILVSGILQPIFLDHDSVHFVNEISLNILVFLLWVPFIVDVFNSMYNHILAIFKQFKKILILSIIKASLVLLPLIIGSSIVFTSIDHEVWMYSIFLVIILSNLMANIVIYFISRKFANNLIQKDCCVNVFMKTSFSFIYLLIVLGLMLPINIILYENVIHLLDFTKVYAIVLTSVAILIINFIVNLINIYLFRKDDFMFYYNEIKNNIKNNEELNHVQNS